MNTTTTVVEHRAVLKIYESCFAWLFPELGLVTLPDSFVVQGHPFKWEEIVTTELTPTHLHLLLTNERNLLLPIEENASFSAEF